MGRRAITCWIYSSPRQDQMYLYLKRKDDFASLPKALLQHFGAPRFVMELELHTRRKLAREAVFQFSRAAPGMESPGPLILHGHIRPCGLQRMQQFSVAGAGRRPRLVTGDP